MTQPTEKFDSNVNAYTPYLGIQYGIHGVLKWHFTAFPLIWSGDQG